MADGNVLIHDHDRRWQLPSMMAKVVRYNAAHGHLLGEGSATWWLEVSSSLPAAVCTGLAVWDERASC